MKRQKAYIGDSALIYLREELQRFFGKHLLLIRDKKAYELCGAKEKIESMVLPLNIHVTEFDDFSENPKIEDIEKGLSLLAQINADIIIGAGGGSTLDMSKLVRFFHSYCGEITGMEYTLQKPSIPLIAIPTTAGTGSEATHFAVLYKDKMKFSIAHEYILPDTAVIYPPFTYSTPGYLTACTGFDALAQAIEAWWNVNATDESDEYAIKAVELLWPNLYYAVNRPTKESKDKVSEGSHRAGKAINITKTTAPHAMSYVFTSYYGIPHGHAVALTFPFWAEANIRYLIENKPIKAKELLSILNIDITNICGEFIEYIRKIQLSFDVASNASVDLVLSKVNNDRLSNNPVKLNSEKFNQYFNMILSK